MKTSAPPRKVLMLCYFYPPDKQAGAARSYAFAKLLSKYGWEPTVMTHGSPLLSPEDGKTNDEPKIVRIPHLFPQKKWVDSLQGIFSRILRMFHVEVKTTYVKDFFCFPDRQNTWCLTIPALYHSRKHDLIYVSCTPFSSALSACLVKAITKKPLVVDFRDPWSYDFDTTHSSLFYKAVVKLEAFVIEMCDALIVTSEGTQKLYRRMFPHLQEKMHYIPNGYDLLPPLNLSPKAEGSFKILHAGSFAGFRNPDALLQAMTDLPSNVEFIQLGNRYSSLEEYRSKVRLQVIPWMERAEALSCMQKANLLYLRQHLTNETAIASKTFEYLATGVPILWHGPPGSNSELVRRYASKAYFVERDDPKEIADAVRKAMNDRSTLMPEVRPEFIQDFDRSKLTSQLALLFDEVVNIRS